MTVTPEVSTIIVGLIALTSTIISLFNRSKLNELHVLINSNMQQALAQAVKMGIAEGMKTQKDDDEARQKGPQSQ
jgi:hypothetical protein